MTISNNKTYDQAIEKLNRLQTNAAALDLVRKSRGTANHRSLPEMRDFVKRLGYSLNDFDGFNAIHVAGTKGKGSTCAFLESMIRQTYGHTVTTGLYTSPHLIEVRERIKINGKPLSKELFSKYFFEVYEKLTQHPEGRMPQYFRFLTLLCFHVFKMENVNAAIVEVGIGGEYDATNILERPSVCGISSLGYDHQSILGESLAQIAWHKSGIFKYKVPAIISNQPNEALEVIYSRAHEKEVHVEIAQNLQSYSEFNTNPEYQRQLGLKGAHQVENAALALALFKKWEDVVFDKRNSMVDMKTLRGLWEVEWPGRGQVIVHDKFPLTFFLDGAHTKESLKSCIDLFKENLDRSDDIYLVFNCTMGRNARDLLGPVCAFHRSFPFKHILFSYNTLASNYQQKDLVNNMVHQTAEQDMQNKLTQTWRELVADDSPISTSPCVNYTFELLEGFTKNSEKRSVVLVTGSLHLVGAFLKLLQ